MRPAPAVGYGLREGAVCVVYLAAVGAVLQELKEREWSCKSEQIHQSLHHQPAVPLDLCLQELCY